MPTGDQLPPHYDQAHNIILLNEDNKLHFSSGCHIVYCMKHFSTTKTEVVRMQQQFTERKKKTSLLLQHNLHTKIEEIQNKSNMTNYMKRNSENELKGHHNTKYNFIRCNCAVYIHSSTRNFYQESKPIYKKKKFGNSSLHCMLQESTDCPPKKITSRLSVLITFEIEN